MANSLTHVLSVPIRNARYTLYVPEFDASGVPTDPTTPDTELVIDGAASTDAAEEVTALSGLAGAPYITISGAEMNCKSAVGQVKNASGPKVPLFIIVPKNYPIFLSGTAAAGAATSITLPASMPSFPNFFTDCFIRTTGGTGGGGTGGANNQARRLGAGTIARVYTVDAWETNPDATTTFDILATPEWLQRVGALGILATVNSVTDSTKFTLNLDLSGVSAQQIVGRVMQFAGGANIYAERVIQTASAASPTVITCKALPGGVPAANDPVFIR